MLCKECGTENIDSALFCVGCGTPLTQPEPPAPAPEQEPAQPKKKKPWLWLAAAGIVALAVILCVALLSEKSDSYSEVAETFVEALFLNDREELSQVLQPQLYEYLDSMGFFEKDAVSCEAEAIGAEPCSESELDELRTLYGLLEAKGDFTNAHCVEVEYTLFQGTQEKTSVAYVTVSEIDGQWIVVNVE